MTRPLLAALALFAAACTRADPPVITLDPAASSAAAVDAAWIKISPGAGPAQAQLAAEAGKAKARALLPVLYLGAAWCKPCNALKRSRGDARMTDAFRGTYVVELELDDWKKAELEALGYGVGAVPAFSRIDEHGRATGPLLTGGAWKDDIPENMAPPLKRFFAP